MFRQLKKLNNESGIVLFFVLMTAIIIMIFSVGILTQSMNEVNYAQQQIDQITSDQLAKGQFWKTYSLNGGNVGITTVMNGRNYGVQLNVIAGASTTYQAAVNYDTLQ